MQKENAILSNSIVFVDSSYYFDYSVAEKFVNVIKNGSTKIVWGFWIFLLFYLIFFFLPISIVLGCANAVNPPFVKSHFEESKNVKSSAHVKKTPGFIFDGNSTNMINFISSIETHFRTILVYWLVTFGTRSAKSRKILFLKLPLFRKKGMGQKILPPIVWLGRRLLKPPAWINKIRARLVFFGMCKY